MNRLRQIALFAAALFPGLLACAQGLPETTVNWETEVVTGEDGTSRIVFTGTPVVPLDQFHGTLQWISCVGESCHSPEELEYDLHPSAAGTGRSQGVPPETHATLGTVRGGTVSEANGGVERSETVSEAVSSRRRMPRWLKTTLIIILILVAVAAVALATFVILAQAAPDFIDSILYTPEELRIINYQ